MEDKWWHQYEGKGGEFGKADSECEMAQCVLQPLIFLGIFGIEISQTVK